MTEMVESVTDARIRWLGHAGFQILFRYQNIERVIYIDPWIGNPKYPAHLKNEDGEAPMPTDADIILITKG